MHCVRRLQQSQYCACPHATAATVGNRSGRRPDATKVWNFNNNFREKGVGDKWIALPEHFVTNGYLVTGAIVPARLCAARVGSRGGPGLTSHRCRCPVATTADVTGTGKLYHPGVPPNFDQPRSWSTHAPDGSEWPYMNSGKVNGTNKANSAHCDGENKGCCGAKDPHYCLRDLEPGYGMIDSFLTDTCHTRAHTHELYERQTRSS